MEKIMDFWNQNGAMITNFMVVFGGAFITFLLNKFLGKTGNKVINYSTQVISKLFGGDVTLGDVDEHIKELPFVKDLKKYSDDIRINSELKLIDLKRKKSLPNLSEVEKLVFENEYKVLYKLLENRISVETLEILDKIDEYTKL